MGCKTSCVKFKANPNEDNPIECDSNFYEKINKLELIYNDFFNRYPYEDSKDLSRNERDQKGIISDSSLIYGEVVNDFSLLIDIQGDGLYF